MNHNGISVGRLGFFRSIQWAPTINLIGASHVGIDKTRAASSRQSIRILFLGQCLNYGYEGVDQSATFTSLAVSMLRLRFPSLTLKTDLKYFYHPRGLKALRKHRIAFKTPDIAIIGLPAMFAAAQWRVSTLYEIAPELIDTARSFAQKIEARVTGKHPNECFKTLVDQSAQVRAPVSLAEYERTVEDAVLACAGSGCRMILMGPGRFNEDSIEDYPIHSPELWRAVNEMVLAMGVRLGLPVINAQEALEDHGGEVFIPQNHRFSSFGHQVIAKEVERVVSDQIMNLRGLATSNEVRLIAEV